MKMTAGVKIQASCKAAFGFEMETFRAISLHKTTV